MAKDFYAERIGYTGRHPTLVRERCRVAPVELAWKFDKDRILDTYKQDDLYIFDLTEYQTKLQNELLPRFIDFLQKCNIRTMLDFGGGIGEYTILAMQNGVNVDFLEVEGSKTLEYAKWRFKKHNVNPRILTEKADLTDKKYDFVMAMDVFEHIPQPDVAVLIAQLSRITKYLWCNPVGLPYNEYYPQHVSHFDEDLRQHFVVAIPQSDLGSIFVPVST